MPSADKNNNSNIKMTPGEDIAPKYSPFNIIETVAYKHVNGVPIPASILMPKSITNQQRDAKYPVLVRWHGGGFATGHRLFPDWYGDWTLDFALKHSAISISPDYRLMPEATGAEILQDARDFYTWLFSSLDSHLPAGISADFSKGILVTGESAGGWMALQAGFLHPSRVGAIISHYPMIDMRSPHFTEAYHKDLMTPPMPQCDPAILESYVQGMEKGVNGENAVITSKDFPNGGNLVMSMVQQGLFPRFFGTDEDLYPLEVLHRVREYPPVWLLHGEVDSVVPVVGTEKFVAKLKEKVPDADVFVSLVAGEEHGFDLHDAASGASATLETEWVKSGVAFVEQSWAKRRA